MTQVLVCNHPPSISVHHHGSSSSSSSALLHTPMESTTTTTSSGSTATTPGGRPRELDDHRNSRLESFDATELLSESAELLKTLHHTEPDASMDAEIDQSIGSVMNHHNHRTRSKSRAIPVSSSTTTTTIHEPQSAASSQGSSGSAFMNSVLNPFCDHTPPTATSYETTHFAKRARSGSVSGRLRSASEYLEDKGLLDRQTKGILKDLIIIGDEELQQALDRYETGDPSSLEQMIRSGALQNRLPQDLDILGDLDLDFLTMDDMNDDVHVPLDNDDDDDDGPTTTHVNNTVNEQKCPEELAGAAQQLQQLHQHHPPLIPYDDGIGELAFAGDFVEDQTSDAANHSQFASDRADSPSEHSNMSEYERRLRSNSLFSALLNDRSAPGVTGSVAIPPPDAWMDTTGSGAAAAKEKSPTNRKGGINIKTKAKNRRTTPTAASGLAASLEADRKKREKAEKKEQRKLERLEKKARQQEKKKEEEKEVHVSGCGRPRTFSDPNLTLTLDDQGLQHVERPEGWVGAYSPDSRKVRIARFLEKRNHRTWTKSVKYDVRKNFADSRLRVKGRFVKKEEETLMRELMSLT